MLCCDGFSAAHFIVMKKEPEQPSSCRAAVSLLSCEMDMKLFWSGIGLKHLTSDDFVSGSVFRQV